MFALALHLLIIGQIGLSMILKISLLFATRILYVLPLLTSHSSCRYANFQISILVFSALRIAYLPEYFHSSNPTYAGIPTAIFALAEVHASIVTATTPLLKSFVLKFRYYGADGPQGQKPLFIVSAYGEPSSDQAPGSRTGSNLTEHEKTTTASSLGGGGRPGSRNNPHSA
jgi:hypothetical protein